MSKDTLGCIAGIALVLLSYYFSEERQNAIAERFRPRNPLSAEQTTELWRAAAIALVIVIALALFG